MKFRSFYLLLLSSVLFLWGCDSSTSPFYGGPLPDAPFPCENGMADGFYPCENVDMYAHLSPQDLLGHTLNDIWGWTDPSNDKEYAIVGMADGVTFVDITDPTEPVVVGTLPESNNLRKTKDDDEEGKSSAWRDIKVYGNHAFVVSDGQPHGLQVFNLTRLRNVEEPPVEFTEDTHYTGFGNAHNIAINEETGFAYVAGSDQYGGGLFILNIKFAQEPVPVGFHADSSVGYNQSGYVHDTQCVVYNGPDSDYAGDEICFNSSETHFVIANVTDKQSTYTIAKSGYQHQRYAHQGWLTEDHRFFLLNDELDHGLSEGTPNIKTFIWDVSDLDNPVLVDYHESARTSIDHNLYIKGNYTYQANYTSGLNILSLDNVANGSLEEVAWFDTFPANDSRVYNGAWGNYPYFENGLVIVSDISQGLFILKPNL